MPRQKMMPPLPDSLGASEHDRFVNFAKTILAVPRSEIMPEQALSKLEDEKRKVESKITNIRRKLAKQKSARSKPHG